MEQTKKTSILHILYKTTFDNIPSRVIFLIAGLFLGVILLGNESPILHGNALAYWTNVFTECLGVIVTIVVINHIINKREREKLQKRLIRQASSPSQAIATEAIAQLREEGWLTGENGVLQNANLRGANLSGADLSGANLNGTKLYQATLAGAILEHANLQNADLRETDLSNARLSRSNCEGAALNDANLMGANAWEVNFKNTNFECANLTQAHFPMSDFTGADLKQAIFAGCNLKSAVLHNVNLSATSFEGATLLGAKIDKFSFGYAYTIMPDNEIYLTILPDGQAILPSEDVKELMESQKQNGVKTPEREYILIDKVDWEQYTMSQHPNYKNWDLEWRKQNHRKND